MEEIVIVHQSEENIGGENKDKYHVALANIFKCMDAIHINNNFSKNISNTLHKAMFQAEDAMLALSSTSFVDGLFYCLVLKMENFVVARYFEHGAFSCYFANAFKPEIENEHEDILPLCVYTVADIEVENQRNNSLFEARRKPNPNQNYHSYTRRLYGNKTSFVNSMTSLMELLKKDENVTCLSMLSFCLHKKQELTSNETKKQFFSCHPTTFAEKWENQLMSFRTVPVDTPNNICLWEPLEEENPSLPQQFGVLSTIPNHQKWSWPSEKSHSVKFEQRFSTSSRHFPASPRNRIMQAITYRSEPKTIIHQCLLNIDGKPVPISYERTNKRKFESKIP